MSEVAASTLAFSRLPLPQALAAVAELGFRSVEIAAHEGWAHVSPARLAEDGAAVTEGVRAALETAGLRAVALNAGLGGAEPARQPRLVAALCRLAAALGAAVVTLPAAPPPAEGIVAAAGAEIQRLSALVGVAAGYGVALAVEGHIGTLTERPETAAGLCRAVPGLRLTLDPSHYWAGAAQGSGWAAVLPHVAHVHLRDAGRNGWAEIQVPVGRGVVDFRAVVAALRAGGYGGAYSAEYIDALPMAGESTAGAESLAMARAAREWLA